MLLCPRACWMSRAPAALSHHCLISAHSGSPARRGFGDFMDKEADSGWKMKEANPIEWCYRGEGAANIVLAYQGSNSSLVGKVLRLKKISLAADKHAKKESINGKPRMPVLTNTEQELWSNWSSIARATSQESLLQAYSRDVIGPLLGPEFVDPGILVLVCSEFLENVASNVHHARPLPRIRNSQIDTCADSALLISDHSIFWEIAGCEQDETRFPSISVEIKPKCGFLPTSDFIAAENSIKKTIPRFTMHQILKLSQGQVKMLSKYSPLDLFSGNLARINQAIDSLFSIPQNNLRVFVGGSMVSTAMSESNSDCANWQILRETLQDHFFCRDQVDPIEALKELVAQSLFETDALEKFLAAQKLDTHDIEGAIHAYRKITHGKGVNCMNAKSLDRLDEMCTDCLDGMSLPECMQLVRNYLIAATAKDCSLMLTFQRVPSLQTENANDYHRIISSPKIKTAFYLKIKFLDLDLKPLSKMVHYHQIDQDIIRAYLIATQSETGHGRGPVELDQVSSAA